MGENIRILHIGDLSSVSEYIVLISCSSDRQVNAVLKSIEEELIVFGEKTLSVEGKNGASSSNMAWILMDYGDVVTHIFHKEARLFYDLDGLWADVKEIEFESEAPAIGEDIEDTTESATT